MGEILQQRIKQSTFSSPHQEAYLALMVAADHIKRQFDEICESSGITGAQYNVLRILRGVYPEGHARCDIIDRMLQVAPDVTRLIDRLEKSGLVRRGRSTEDGRLSLTYITDKGLDLLRSMEDHVKRSNEALSKVMTPAEAQMLTSLCERIFAE
jgi:DNA-binding MarR family transcriptional regulator